MPDAASLLSWMSVVKAITVTMTVWALRSPKISSTMPLTPGRASSHVFRGDSMMRLSEDMRCASHASRGDSMMRLSEDMRCDSHASRGDNMVKLGETVERSSMCSYDLEDRDPLECEIENGPSCRYDPTNNLQDATITLNTIYNSTNFHYLLFLCCQAPEQDLLLHWTLALFEHLVKLWIMSIVSSLMLGNSIF